MNINNQVPNCRLGKVELLQCQQAVKVAFRAEVASGPVSAVSVCHLEVHPFICPSSWSARYLRSGFGKEGFHPFDFDESAPGVFLSHHSPSYA